MRALKVGVLALLGFWLGVAGVLTLCSLVSAPPVACFEILSVRPERSMIVLFNACTGNVEVRVYAAPPPSSPSPSPAPSAPSSPTPNI